MYRGEIKFKCNKCGTEFMAPDIELNATVYSVPQPCPKCGSIDTQPCSDSPSIIEIVKRIVSIFKSSK